MVSQSFDVDPTCFTMAATVMMAWATHMHCWQLVNVAAEAPVLLRCAVGAIYVTLPMVRSRGKATTYQNMRGPVQNFCGRDFQVWALVSDRILPTTLLYQPDAASSMQKTSDFVFASVIRASYW